jgi:hypothetical protein
MLIQSSHAQQIALYYVTSIFSNPPTLGLVYGLSLSNEGMMAVVQHFAFNEQETMRDSENSLVDARAAWELC